MVRGGLQMLAVVVAMAVLGAGSAAYGQRGGGGGGRRSSNNNNNNNNQQQRPQVNPAIQQDQQALQTAYAEQTKAQTTLDLAIKKAQSQFDSAPDTLAAQKAIDDASAALDKARTAVVEKLKKNPAYKAAADKEDAANAKVADLQKRHAPQSTIADASDEAFKLSATTDKLLRAALEGDSDYLAAQQKLVDASKALADMKKSFLDGLKENTDVKALYTAKDAAATKVTEAQTKLNADSLTTR